MEPSLGNLLLGPLANDMVTQSTDQSSRGKQVLAEPGLNLRLKDQGIL